MTIELYGDRFCADVACGNGYDAVTMMMMMIESDRDRSRAAMTVRRGLRAGDDGDDDDDDGHRVLSRATPY